MQAAAGLPRSILLENLDLHAALVPHRAAVRDPAFTPEPHPKVRWNILVLHAQEGVPGRGGVFVDPAEWNYVALGGEHRRRQLSPRVQYPGSLERVALDPWDEAGDEKGFLAVDLERGDTTFHPVPGRPVVALAPIRVAPGDPERLRRRVSEVTREVPGGIAGKIVRLRLEGVDPEDLLCLQGEQLRALRQEALHLAVEAGREPRVPTEAWLPAEAPRLLRSALVGELERDALADAATLELVDALVRDPSHPAGGAERVGVLEALDSELPGLGRVSTSISPGLTAIIGGTGRLRRALTSLLLESASRGEGPVARLWTGYGGETLDGALNQAVEAVAHVRGLHVVSQAIERARSMGGPGHGVAGGEGSSGIAAGTWGDPERVLAELHAAERELRSLRADAVEADGDLEVATMDWLRERQDAETTLHAYRDRAREVKLRIRKLEAAGPEAPCPTCARVLEARHGEVLEELKEEWESIVQDGSWWRRRWEQLELKPPHLQELEGRVLRLHSALEATSERVELLRARVAELSGRSPSGTLDPVRGPLGHLVAALMRVREARVARARETLLSRASRYVGRISGGRLLAITWTDGVTRLQGDSGPLAPVSEEDLALGRLALRLAAASQVAAGGSVLASLVLEEPFDRLDTEAGVRTLLLLRRLLREIPRIVLVTRGDLVDAQPELFDAVLEVRDDARAGHAALRPIPAGGARLILGMSVEPPRAPWTR